MPLPSQETPAEKPAAKPDTSPAVPAGGAKKPDASPDPFGPTDSAPAKSAAPAAGAQKRLLLNLTTRLAQAAMPVSRLLAQRPHQRSRPVQGRQQPATIRLLPRGTPPNRPLLLLPVLLLRSPMPRSRRAATIPSPQPVIAYSSRSAG